MQVYTQLRGYVDIYVYGWVQRYMGTGICIYGQVQVDMDSQVYRYIDSHIRVYAPGAPLRGKRSGGGCQEQLNVCLIV